MSPKDKKVETLAHAYTYKEVFQSFNHLCYWEVAACLSELARFEKALKLTKDPDPKAGDKWMKRKETERGTERMRRWKKQEGSGNQKLGKEGRG